MRNTHTSAEDRAQQIGEALLPDRTAGRGPLRAIIWDYDGTLVDTRNKNLCVTRAVIEHVAKVDPLTFPALQSLEAYVRAQTSSTNWRDFYEREFGFGHELIDETGRAWSAFQLVDRTPIEMFDGIPRVLHRLGHLPHGIVSQNSRDAIAHVLDMYGLRHYFSFIVGYEEVDIRLQKPAPDGLLHCVEKVMNAPSGTVLYIGDHETDALCARNANEELHRAGKPVQIASIGAHYSQSGSLASWSVQPDFHARNVEDIVLIADSLSPAADGSESPADHPIL